MSSLDFSNISPFSDSPFNEEQYLAEAKEAGFDTLDEYIAFLNEQYQESLNNGEG